MTGMSNLCPICRERIPPDAYLCGHHASLVPRHLANEVYRAKTVVRNARRALKVIDAQKRLTAAKVAAIQAVMDKCNRKEKATA